jgi:hypothetical protein
MNLYHVHAHQSFATDGAPYKTFVVAAASEERARAFIEGRLEVQRVDLVMENVRDLAQEGSLCWAGGPHSLVE